MGIFKKAVKLVKKPFDRVVKHVKTKYMHYTSVGSVALLSSNSAMAAASKAYDVKIVTDGIKAGEAPVALVASATVGILVVLKVWSLIKRAI